MNALISARNSFLKFPVFLKLLVITAMVLTIWFGYNAAIKSKVTAPQYQTVKAEKGSLVSAVAASGQVLSVNILSANTKASGIVKKVYVKDGDKVNKGDKILELELDPQGEQKYTQAWSSYLAAKNSLETAKISEYTLQADLFDKWDAFKILAENGTYTNSDGSPNRENRNLPDFYISNNNWLAAEARYKNQQSVVAQSQASVNSAWMTYIQSSPVITAPADGTITSLMYAEGMTIGSLDTGTSTSNQKVATVQTSGTPIVTVNISEIDVSRVQLEQKVTVVLDSIPDKTFTGKVIGVDRIGQTVSGVTQYPGIIRLDVESPDILPNMAVTANIVINTVNNVILVPSSALSDQNGQQYANILIQGKSQLVPVETGLSSDSQTEIVSGLKAGDTVITGTAKTTTGQTSQSPFGGTSGIGQMMRVPR